MKKILFIGDYSLYEEKFRSAIQSYYLIDFLDSLSIEVANSTFLPYNMILLDYNILKEHSYALCRAAKKMHISVLFLFPMKCLELEILHSYDAGSDDYIYPSLSTSSILLKKIELILSKVESAQNNIYQDSHMILDFNSLTAIIDSTTIKFTPLEFKLLKLFINNSNTVLTRQQIIYHLWDKQENYVEESSLNGMICRIRHRIDTDSHHYVRTIYGVGYIWNDYQQ